MALDLDAAALFLIAASVCVAYLVICFVLLGGMRAISGLTLRMRRASGCGRRAPDESPRTRARNKILL